MIGDHAFAMDRITAPPAMAISERRQARPDRARPAGALPTEPERWGARRASGMPAGSRAGTSGNAGRRPGRNLAGSPKGAPGESTIAKGRRRQRRRSEFGLAIGFLQLAAFSLRFSGAFSIMTDGQVAKMILKN